jgi:hypothetical protein
MRQVGILLTVAATDTNMLGMGPLRVTAPHQGAIPRIKSRRVGGVGCVRGVLDLQLLCSLWRMTKDTDNEDTNTIHVNYRDEGM